MKKIVIFTIIAAVAITLGIVVGVKMETGKSKETNSSSIQKKPIINANNENSDKQNNSEVEQNNEIANYENIDEEEEEEEPTNDLEKAIYIVKKDWGKDDTVRFDYDGTTNNGDYVIAVHEKSTTKALAWYTVNVKTGVFVKE